MVQEKVLYVSYRPEGGQGNHHEDVTVEDLGGAAMHASRSGVSDYPATTEEDAIDYIHRLLSFLPQNNMENPPVVECSDPGNRRYRRTERV